MSLIKKIARTLVGKPPTKSNENESSPKETPNRSQQDSDQKRSDRPSKQAKDQSPRRSRNPRNATSKPDSNNDSNRSNRSKPNKDRNNQSSSKRSQQNPRKKTQRPQSQSNNQPQTTQKVRPTITEVDPIGFNEMGLRPAILKAIGEQGYSQPTPIQQAAIEPIAKGRDLLGCAQTGTGKTASFALPTLERLARNIPKVAKIRALALTPTRELAIQVGESFESYGRHLELSSTVVFGGVGAEPQKRKLKRGIDILVATPGRLLDLHGQGHVDFTELEILILDEADRMLDMGFLPDVRRIIKLLPTKRQNILLSATMPKDIAELSKQILKDPVRVEVAPVSSTSDQINQSLYFINKNKKRDLLLHVLEEPTTQKVLIFTRTKSIANRITKFLIQNNISAEAIHGNKSQSARQKALENFKVGETRILVATDLAARGLDVDDITHVINFDLPNIAETYVHRIGRTGRALATGNALSFCDGEEQAYLRTIENLIEMSIPVITEHPFPYNAANEPEPTPQRSNHRQGRRGPQQRSGSTPSARRGPPKPRGRR